MPTCERCGYAGVILGMFKDCIGEILRVVEGMNCGYVDFVDFAVPGGSGVMCSA